MHTHPSRSIYFKTEEEYGKYVILPGGPGFAAWKQRKMPKKEVFLFCRAEGFKLKKIVLDGSMELQSLSVFTNKSSKTLK